MVEYINGLQVFKGNITTSALHEIQDSWKDLSGGQKKKLFLINEFITCPDVLILDETFGPLHVEARSFTMNQIKNSCLKDSLILVVWHQDKNPNNSTCVIDQFFDYEVHLENNTVALGEVSGVCD